MSGYPRLLVANGLHAGASVMLAEGHALKIGSAAGADLILADHGVAPHHATVTFDGSRLLVHAMSDGVAVFGRPLKSGAQTYVSYGATFGLGPTLLQFSHGEQLAHEDARRAEYAWLLRHAPLAWLRKRFVTLPLGAWIAIAVVVLALALAHALNLFAPRGQSRPASALLDQPAYRHVQVNTEKDTGRRIYEGYVQTAGELGALSFDARAQGGTAILRVAVIDAMQEQLSDFLDKYYRGATLRAAEPGAFVATAPAADAYLLPESWDYARVERLARAQVDGLRKLRFAGHENDSGPVRVPLEMLGLNLLATNHSAWLVDAQGARFFIGSRIQMGRIIRLEKCGATVQQDDGTTYVLTTAKRAATTGPC